ncbi:MAG TPA: MFS transporter [Stellaceae bacterium]|nr:MFS transporter [Stellaceae bacterium]
MGGISTTGSRDIEVTAVLERRGIGSVQLLVLGLCALAMMIDGYDLYVVGYVLPAIAKDLGVAPASLTPVLLAQQVGLALGSFLVSPFADRFGRRTVLLASVALFGLFTLAVAQAHSIAAMAPLRFLAGAFLSGVIPNAIALTTEIAPPRLRATMVTIMFCGFTFGTATGGYFATRLLDAFGWQGAFWGGGLLPLALLPLWAVLLPESLQFRLQRDDRDPEIGRLLVRIDPTLSLDGGERFVLDEASAAGAPPVLALFQDGRAASTLLLWFSFFMGLLAIYLTAAWMPTFFTSFSRMTLTQAAEIGLVMATSGIVTMLFYGRLLDRFGPARVLPLTYLGGALAVAAIGFVDWDSWALYPAVVVEGACVIGGQSGLNALAAILYPTRMRATGIGWAFGAGRFGSIFGPAIGGFMLARHWNVGPVFLVTAAPILLVAAGTALVGFRGADGKA